MALATFSDLKTSTANWLHRDDLTANIVDFIMMAEWRLARDLRVAPLLASSTIAVSAGATSFTLPTSCMEVVNVQVSAGGAELHYVPPDTIDRIPAGNNIPWAYTIFGTTVLIAPSWTAGGNLDISYISKPTILSDSNTTNWFLTNAPDALLYATLLEAAPFLVNDNRITVWMQFYKTAASNINRQYGNVDQHLRILQNGMGLSASSSLDILQKAVGTSPLGVA